MEQGNYIKAESIEEIKQQLTKLLGGGTELLDFNTTIDDGSHKVVINVDIDLGGGFESGYETTTLLSQLHTNPSFKFAIHREHFSDEIGKFFGMQDVELGYPEFDKKLIVKTNDPVKLHDVFSDPAARAIFENLDDFTFGTTTHHVEGTEAKEPFLELILETGITEADELMKLYDAFHTVLVALDTV